MATNRKFEKGSPLRLTVASPTVSGDPIVLGQLPGVALTDYSATDEKATVELEGVWDLEVEAVNGSGNSAVAVGDAIYYTAGDDPHLNKKTTGVKFGHALEAVTSGESATIMVRIQPVVG